MKINITAHGKEYITGGEGLECPECKAFRKDEIDFSISTEELSLDCECLECGCVFEVTRDE